MNRNEIALKGNYYFPNLTGLRFWMSFTVVQRHIEEIKYMRHIEYSPDHFPKFHTTGFYPMLMFFALSGFLITYQLETEKANTNTINNLKFYKNRALRILPLFYLSIFFYWFLLPYSPIGEYYNSVFFKPLMPGIIAIYDIPKWILFILSVFLLPHLAYVITLFNNRSWLYGVQHWSIGVEEIFYLFWPILWKRIKSFKHFIIKCFIGYYTLLIGSFLLYFVIKKLFHIDWLSNSLIVLFYFITFSNSLCFFFGAIGIYIYLYRQDLIKKYINKITASISFLFLIFCLFSDIELPIIMNELMCISFITCILFLIKDGKGYLIFEHPVISYLGKITYPVYLIHFGVIIIVMYFLEKYEIQKQSLLLFNILQYAGTYILTYLVSGLLFEFYGKKFLAFRSL